jgi:hypothetical protein
VAKYVVDCGVVLRLVADDVKVPAKHAPTLLRSQALSALHEAVHAGKLSPKVARERLARVNPCPSASSKTPSCDAAPGRLRTSSAGRRRTPPSTWR